MRTRLFRAIMTGIAILIMVSSPAGAMIDGEYAGPDDYPYVGLMVAKDGEGGTLWRCSGTLIAPTLFLTAGHCTYGATSVEIWFAHDVEDNQAGYNYPKTGDVSGTPYTHPDYVDSAFYLYDLGMVVLDEPVSMDRYGALPGLDQLDSLATQRGRQDTTFTAVGYGVQASFPDPASWKNVEELYRMISQPRLIQINTGLTGPGSILLSNNANTGGTCSGDSGGPNFIGDTKVIGGVTSFGMNGTCSGTGGVYRIDRADDLNWIYEMWGDLLP